MEENLLGNSESETRFYKEISNSLTEDENILWASSPKGKYSIYAVQKNRLQKIFSNVFTLIIMAAAIYFIISERLYSYTLILLLYFMYTGAKGIYAIYNLGSTHYALTENRLFIQTKDRFKTVLKHIDISNIRLLQVESEINNKGSIFIFCYRHPEIYTYDYDTGEMRESTTLEEVDHPQQIVNLINKLRSVS